MICLFTTILPSNSKIIECNAHLYNVFTVSTSIYTQCFTLFFFIFTTSFASDGFDNVSKNLFVSHYDCTKMQDNRMCSLNKVSDCKITPENLYVTPATITLFQKNYRHDMAATLCSVKVHVSLELWEVFAFVLRSNSK